MNNNENELMDLLFTTDEQDKIYKLPDQWEKRNKHIIRSGIEERYRITSDGDVIDLLLLSKLTLRLINLRLANMVELEQMEGNDQRLGERMRSLLRELNKETIIILKIN